MVADFAVVSITSNDLERFVEIVMSEFQGTRAGTYEVRGSGGVFDFEFDEVVKGYPLEVEIDTRDPDVDAKTLLRRLAAEGISAIQAVL